LSTFQLLSNKLIFIPSIFIAFDFIGLNDEDKLLEISLDKNKNINIVTQTKFDHKTKIFFICLLDGLVDEINTYTGHCGAVNAVSLNGELAASGSGDRQVHLWNTATCSPRATYHHAHVVESVSFVDSNILSGSWDGELKLFDIHHDHARTLLQVSRLFLAFAVFEF